MKVKLFQVKLAKITRPLIAHVPHSSTRLDEAIRPSVLLTKTDLVKELRVMTDWYTDEIFGCAVKAGGIAFINNQSRLFYDPERFEDKRLEKMEKVGMGLIYTRTHDGRVLRNRVSTREHRRVVLDYYRPYHNAFAAAITKIKKRFGYCLIVDGHSFSSCPLPYEPSQSRRRPDICIGTDRYHTPPRLVKVAEAYFKKHGLRVGLNDPYSGTFVPTPFYRRDSSVLSIMIEINRALYLDELRAKKTRRFKSIIRLVEGLIASFFNTADVLL